MTNGVRIDRYTSREHNVLAARGEFTSLFAAYRGHARRWVGEPDGLAYTMMRQGLAAAALYLTCRPRDEQTAWTLNLPEPPLNVFFAADAGRGRVVGRYYTEHVNATAHSRLFVQIARSRGEPHQSFIEVTGFDVLAILEQYYARSEQAGARFFELPDDTFIMLMALPGIDEEWLKALSPDEASAFVAGPQVSLIEQREVVFECACDEARILEIIAGIFHGKLDELFGGEGVAEVTCPRCGRAFDITRAALERLLADR
jgi:molecular chaperone Hsp33